MKYKITMEIIRAYKDPQIPLVNLHESTYASLQIQEAG